MTSPTGEKSLLGKTALVTGGGRNIGKAIAERLASDGAIVAVNYASNSDAANETVEGIIAKGGKAFAVRGKIGTAGAIDQIVIDCEREFQKMTGQKGLDILVNNIGGGDYATIQSVTPEVMEQTFTNNVFGPFFLTQALYDKINDHGRVINISSVGSRLAGQNFVAYSMAKAALDNFTRVLAKDLGPRGITVNAVAPGFTAVATNDEELGDEATAASIRNSTSLRRIGQPEEIADLVYLCASHEGRWMTGQWIDASGGFMT